MLVALVILVVTLVSAGLNVIVWWREFAHKPTTGRLSQLRNVTLTHFCSGASVISDDAVSVRAKEGFERNFSTFSKPATYFFVGEPTKWGLLANRIMSYEYKVSVPFANLDPAKVLYRPVDNVVAYLGDYEGTASIFESPMSSESEADLRRLRKTIPTVLIFLLLVWTYVNLCLVGLCVSAAFHIGWLISLEAVGIVVITFNLYIFRGAFTDMLRRKSRT